MINACTTPKYPLSTPKAKSFASLADNLCENPYTPETIDLAYSVNKNDFTGNGITVAVVVAYGNDTAEADFRRFGEEYGLPENRLEIYYTGTRTASYVRSWSIETSSDTQWIYATAPAARIMCIIAHSAEIEALFSGVRLAIENGADIVSMSWGSSEFIGQEQYSAYMRNSEKIFISSAGDTGGSVVFPSSSDASVSVGGTSLFRTSKINVFARSAWINGGGGPSIYTGIPDWQRKFDGIPRLSGTHRATPDIALDANTCPGYSIYNSAEGGFLSVGGTSVSAPVFAGICAQLLQTNPQALENMSMPEYLYFLAGETQYDSPQYFFNDITVGSNGVYNALYGFDLATGLGAPIAEQIMRGRR